MARPLRLEFPGALFHVTARGNRKQIIFRDDCDRLAFLDRLGKATKRFDWIVTAYVLMSNHFHILLQLTRGTLSRGMHWLNSTYPQAFNRRHGMVGHLLQGRFGAQLIEKQTYFLEVLRYVVLNPVRAGIVARPQDYAWSSHRAVMGLATAPDWLAIDDALVQFAANRDLARARYQHFVESAIGATATPWQHLVGRIYLGSEAWVKDVRARIELKPRSDDHPCEQRIVGEPTMSEVIDAVARTFHVQTERIRNIRGGPLRHIAAWIASNEALLRNREIAAGLRLRSSGYVSELVRQCDQQLDQNWRFRSRVNRCISTLRRKNCEPKA